MNFLKTILLIFIYFSLNIIEVHSMLYSQQTDAEGESSNTNELPPSLNHFVMQNETKEMIGQEYAIAYLKLFYQILEETDYAVNYTHLEDQIDNMVEKINGKFLQKKETFGDHLWRVVVKMSRQCQQIGVDIEQTMQHGQEFERNFGKKMCRLAMFVSLAQFISIEMKKILKEYAKGIIPRACAKIRRLFGRSAAIQTAADGAGTGSTTTPSMVQRECKAKLMVIYMDIKMNEIYFEKIFDFMIVAKDLMIKTRADVGDPRHIQSARIKQQLEDLINQEQLLAIIETKIEFEKVVE